MHTNIAKAPRTYDTAQHQLWLAHQRGLPAPPAFPDTLRAMVDVPRALGPDLARRLGQVCASTDWTARPWTELRTCDLSPGAIWVRSEPLAYMAGTLCEGAVSAAAGRPMYLSRAGVKVHRRGDLTIRHRDTNPANSNLLTWTAAAAPDFRADAWPLWIDSPSGVTSHATPAGGEGLFFAALHCEHWRVPCPAEWVVQMYMRYSPDKSLVIWTPDELDALRHYGERLLEGEDAFDAANRLIKYDRERIRLRSGYRWPWHRVVPDALPADLRAEILDDREIAHTFIVPDESRAARALEVRRLDGRIARLVGQALDAALARADCPIPYGDRVGHVELRRFGPGHFWDTGLSEPATGVDAWAVLRHAHLGGAFQINAGENMEIGPGAAVFWDAANLKHRWSVVRRGETIGIGVRYAG